ncbi:hypothetical protein F5884DRAFT_768495 [Xylogone sp. PMI_703]|nr:hypothetical protein F5884DRAFT_768495 [Xylogone sp. PMI_703]
MAKKVAASLSSAAAGAGAGAAPASSTQHPAHTEHTHSMKARWRAALGASRGWKGRPQDLPWKSGWLSGPIIQPAQSDLGPPRSGLVQRRTERRGVQEHAARSRRRSSKEEGASRQHPAADRGCLEVPRARRNHPMVMVRMEDGTHPVRTMGDGRNVG